MSYVPVLLISVDEHALLSVGYVIDNIIYYQGQICRTYFYYYVKVSPLEGSLIVVLSVISGLTSDIPLSICLSLWSARISQTM